MGAPRAVRTRLLLPPLARALLGHGAGDDGGVLPLFGDGGEPGRALGRRHEERLRARALDAIPALELGAVDGEVGLVDELVRVRPVLWKAGDAEGDRGANRLARRLD